MMMKKMLCMLLTLALLPAVALAEGDAATANGVVESAHTYEVVAPFSGTLLPFDWELGDEVGETDVLFSLDTQKVYAPESGRLTSLFVAVGELCEDATAQYGMVAAIEKDVPFTIATSTKGAYNDADNKLLHMGMTVYFKPNSGDEEGEGVIIAVDGDDFVVEVTDSGELDPGDTVKLYRDDDMTSKKYIGQGKLARAGDVKVQAAGRVLRLGAAVGDKVEKGQLLMELAASDAPNGLDTADVLSGHAGALTAVKVAPGQQVYKGQSLATVADLSELNVVAEVDEIDLNNVKIGDSLKIVFDRYPSDELQGTVKQISRVGQSKQNAAYYDVELAVMTALEVLPGMNATVYIPSGKQ